jgi:arylsulfatase A-like enzyme
VPYSTADASRAQRRSLLSVDRMVDRLMQKVPSNTLVIFLSDNGYMLGEHGIREDKRLPYMESVRIPLLMRWPGQVATGRIDTRFAANVDVAPTIAAAAGVTAALPAMDGRNLLSDYKRTNLLLESYQTIENANDRGFPPWRSLLTPQGQYTEWLSPDKLVTFREFYDASDRYQMTNLVATEPLRAAALIKPLKPLLSAYATCRGAACP